MKEKSRFLYMPSYFWLFFLDSLTERLEGFHCHVEQGIFMLYLPIALLWQLRRQHNMIEEVKCCLEAKRRHSDHSKAFSVLDSG